MLIRGFLDRVELDLTLPDLDSVGANARRRLSAALSPVHVRSKVIVNGKPLKRP